MFRFVGEANVGCHKDLDNNVIKIPAAHRMRRRRMAVVMVMVRGPF